MTIMHMFPLTLRLLCLSTFDNEINFPMPCTEELEGLVVSFATHLPQDVLLDCIHMAYANQA
jgi:AAA+ superfamily predicted ATPase